MKKGKEKGRKITLKNASFWAINSLHPPCRKLMCRGKKMNLKKGDGEKNEQNAQYISLHIFKFILNFLI